MTDVSVTLRRPLTLRAPRGASEAKGVSIQNSINLGETLSKYSKHPHIRTHNFRGQTDCVLIYRMLSEKSASGCS